jgi:hypothetical protein
MPITSFDYLMKRVTSGFTYRSNWNYNPSAALSIINKTYDLSFLTGLNTFPGTPLAWNPCNSSSSFAMTLPSANNISSNETLHLTHALGTLNTNAADRRGTFVLVDLQGYWANISLATTSVQNLTGTPGSDLRYANGAGCRLYMVNRNNQTGSATDITLSYTNQAGTTGRTLPYNVGTLASATNIAGCVSHSGGIVDQPRLTNYLPFSGSDTGVANVASVTMTVAATGVAALCLARPIALFPLTLRGTGIETNFITQLTSLPEVKKDACLILLYSQVSATTAVTSNFSGSLNFVWG